MELTDKNTVIALPTYNEELAIDKMIKRIRSQTDFPIMIIDGYSSDRTVEIAKNLNVEVIERTAGKGYGCAIQKALEVAANRDYDWLIILDCDMTYRPEEIKQLVSSSYQCDLVVGVRPMHRISFSHRLANRSHSLLASVLYNQQVSDINSGMRMLRVSKFVDSLTERNMGMVAQISSIAMRNRWLIRQVPIEYDKRIGDSKIDVWDWFVISWCILREWFTTPSK